MLHQLLTVLKAGATYFGMVFVAGFAFGLIRILLLVPRFGERVAELMEMPLMLVVIVIAAKWVVRKFEVRATISYRLMMGLLALCLISLIEFTLVLELRGLTLAEYFHERDSVSGTAYSHQWMFLSNFAEHAECCRCPSPNVEAHWKNLDTLSMSL